MQQRQGAPIFDEEGNLLPRHPPALQRTLTEIVRKRGLDSIPNTQCHSAPYETFESQEALDLLQEVEQYYTSERSRQIGLEKLIRAKYRLKSLSRLEDRVQRAEIIANVEYLSKMFTLDPAHIKGLLRPCKLPRNKILTRRAVLMHSAYMSTLEQSFAVDCEQWYAKIGKVTFGCQEVSQLEARCKIHGSKTMHPYHPGHDKGIFE